MTIHVGDVYSFENDNHPGIQYLRVVAIKKKYVDYVGHPDGKYTHQISRSLFEAKPDHLAFIRNEKEA